MINKKQIFDLIEKEKQRQENEICLIASENSMSGDVLEANGSVLVNKYSEGYPAHRYYGGCEVVDEIEQAAIDNACELFKCKYANVQPNSGCQANQAVYMSVCKPGDTILAMGVNEGGHISHSLNIGFAGVFYNVVKYGLTDNGYLNYDEIREKLYSDNPRLLIIGGSAYPREIDFKRIREIVDEYNKGVEYKCIMMVDMAHISGLVATEEHMSPLPYADVVTSTVQKTLRSSRGGLILTNNEELIKLINKNVFPCLQGGPLQNMIAGKAVGFAEALQPEFKVYIQQVKKNIKAMENVFLKEGVKLMTGGSDNHLLLIDLKETNVTGQMLETALEKIGIITNKNAVKNDPRPKTETSGLRVGTAAVTTRGATENDCSMMAHVIASVIMQLNDYGAVSDEQFEISKNWVTKWCKEHPIYK